MGSEVRGRVADDDAWRHERPLAEIWMDASYNLWCKCSMPGAKNTRGPSGGQDAYTLGSRLSLAAKNRIEPKEMTIATHNEDNGNKQREPRQL